MNEYEQVILLLAQTTYLCVNKPVVTPEMYYDFRRGITQITNEVSVEFGRSIVEVEQDVADFIERMPTEDLDTAIQLRAENKLH